jgi:hypothetical protein
MSLTGLPVILPSLADNFIDISAMGSGILRKTADLLDSLISIEPTRQVLYAFLL